MLLVMVETSVHPAMAAALGNAHALVHAERVLHLAPAEFASRSVQLPALLATSLYVGLHFLGTSLVMLWARVRRPQVWRAMRWSLPVIVLVGLVVNDVLPVAPPWLLGAGDGTPSAHVLGSASGVNSLGAFPSLHVAVAVWVALLLRRAGVGRLAWLYPAGVAWLVLSTGNHYLLDVAAGAALAFVVVSAFSLREGVKKWLPTPQPSPLSAPPRAV